jgi:3'-phosphoadenosine 5'-phosphosulfate (PAPS) 3'-phosphatase
MAATEAGAAVVRARYGSSLARFGKSPIDFAIDADIESERAIMNVLRAARPTDGFIGEEAGAEGRDATGEVDAVTKGSGYTPVSVASSPPRTDRPMLPSSRSSTSSSQQRSRATTGATHSRSNCADFLTQEKRAMS